jgi:hypothetical protein
MKNQYNWWYIDELNTINEWTNLCIDNIIDDYIQEYIIIHKYIFMNLSSQYKNTIHILSI